MNSIFIIDHSDDSTELKDSTQMIRQVCKYDFYILIEESSMESSYNNVERLSWLYRSIETKLGEDSIRANTRIDAGLWSHFVSLTFKNVKDVLPNLHEIQKGADAFELRVDLLEDQSALSIHRQLAILRSQCPLPIVFTVRSIGQIGKYPEDPEKIFSLLREGLRGYAEWIDVEACWPENLTKAFVNEAINRYRSTSRLLGSLHVTTPQTSSQIQGLYDACDLYGFADIVKVVTGAENDEDCQRVHDVARALSKPYIGICLGAKGSLSRVLNKCFTPVCHPAMAAAAPGQLSAQELMKERVDRKLVSPLNFYLFGTPIKQSLSPGMHNAAFNQLLLPHHYHLQEEEDVDAYRELINLESFGGSSVTIPHKESIMPYLHEVRGAATSIGAVNTIVIEYENTTNESGENTMMRRKVGYNTDWLGIREPIIQRLQTRGNVWKKTGSIGLVNGAGKMQKILSIIFLTSSCFNNRGDGKSSMLRGERPW
jgi:pentafunctional AROM polypeptide